MNFAFISIFTNTKIKDKHTCMQINTEHTFIHTHTQTHTHTHMHTNTQKTYVPTSVRDRDLFAQPGCLTFALKMHKICFKKCISAIFLKKLI